MGDALRLYFRYLGLSLRGQMQYRASFWMLTLGQMLITGIEFLGIWALFDRFGSLRGWSLPEVALLYGIVNCAFALAEGVGRGFDIFPEMVKSGDFDRLLLRPRSTALQVAGLEMQLMRIGRLVQGLAVLLWAASALHALWTPARVALLLFAICGGACLFYGLFILQATLSFWTIETLEIMNTVTYGGTETAQYPMTIYRPWFRLFFTFVVPLACMNYLPANAILGRSPLPGLPLFVPWVAPAVGIIFLALTLQIWRLGVRHYRSTGN
ncbi:MAG TPA: ABC-2 family transporter protein [Chthonomonadaceae bacterium]|nr:ABC-2 family transporter protein [Chthonomonadaceae bacterium]